MTLLFALLASMSLVSSDNPFTIESDEATSGDNALTLSGHVKIHAKWLEAESEKAFCPHDRKGLVTLQDHVLVTLPRHGTLSCDSAVLDEAHNLAHFSGEKAPFVYENKELELTVRAFMGTVNLSPNGKSVQTIEAKTDVEAVWKKSLICRGAKAFFFPDNKTVFFEREKEPCRLLVEGLSDLYCNSLEFALKENLLSLTEPKGQFFFQKGEALYLRAQTMQYKEAIDQIELKGDVFLKTNLNTGPAELSSVDFCLIDEAQETIVVRPLLGKQLLLQTPYGFLKADHATVYYEKDDQKDYRPSKLLLEGDVEISNTFSFKDPETAVNRYALADSVEIDCFEKIMTLKSKTKKRVLFFDEEKKVQVSAEAIAVCYKDGGEEISGKGAVRMLFNESELSEFAKAFPTKNQ